MNADKIGGVCDSYCRGCDFLGEWATSGFRICEYSIITGELRPCRAGTGCTVRRGRKYTGKVRAKKTDAPVCAQPVKKKEQVAQNRLDLDMIESEKAGFGVSYGAWKASQPVNDTNKSGIPEGWRICQICGKPYKPKTKQATKYCGYACRELARYDQKRINNEKKRAENAKRSSKEI